ncbi:MAG: hypothetical protein CMG02_01350 [Candidatus Marinimicrobia bacterium]|nr:hypothetical protein [Candidatus Neomarinimicrobiota bacterium]RPG05230.1 MAG: glycosyltransferase [Pelagibacteraceae bacterium TMED247]|tara:strand:- start:269 stop:1102 length:834 start_codon:yes stop_codon:yes gene_type:complete
MSIKDITIIITSFKSEKKIRRCLNSIDSQCNVINVENSNNQQYKLNIEKDFANVKCILSGANLGYGKGNNIGLKQVRTKYALILNPDAELFPETLKEFLTIAKEKKDFAIIGPGIVEDKKISTGNHETKAAKAIKGFAMFLNLSEFKETGFFDENFFFFLEEIDLCTRLLKKDKKIYHCPGIPVYHEGGHSHDSSFNYEMELSRNWHWMWSTFYYNKKHKGFIISFLIIGPKIFSSIFKFLLFSMLKNRKKKEIYYQRFSGLANSIAGKNSWYRPKV